MTCFHFQSYCQCNKNHFVLIFHVFSEGFFLQSGVFLQFSLLIHVLSWNFVYIITIRPHHWRCKSPLVISLSGGLSDNFSQWIICKKYIKATADWRVKNLNSKVKVMLTQESDREVHLIQKFSTKVFSALCSIRCVWDVYHFMTFKW